MNPLRNPISVVILNFLVGALAAKGYISPENVDEVVNRLIEIGGVLILLVTSIISLKPLIHLDKEDIKHIIRGDFDRTRSKRKGSSLIQSSNNHRPSYQANDVKNDTGTPPVFTQDPNYYITNRTEQH